MRIAVLGGGRSSEHDVSMSSAASVRSGLLEGGHEVLPVHIDRAGRWHHDGEELALHPGRGLLGTEVVFPALHGPFGEDGTIQGLLEALEVPYVGSDVAASALCIDKVLSKRLMESIGTPQVRYAAVRADRWRCAPRAVLAELAELGPVVFVKPARLGSSVGIARACSEQELEHALDAAFVHDPLAIVEAAAPGVEVECGVLATLRHGRESGAPAAIASQPGEISYAGDWYDYEAKYSPGGMELIVPARIPPVAAARVRELAVRAFIEMGCDGLARADFFVDGEEVLLNELNTMPGFTPTSVYAKLLEASDVPYPQLVERLCLLACERHAERAAFTY